MRKVVKRPFRRDLLVCYWTGRILGSISQRIDCAGGDLNDRNFRGAEENIYQAKLDLERGAWAIGKSTSKRLTKLLDDPLQAVKKAQQTVREGKQGPVSRGRLRPAEQALTKAMNRASGKCH